MRKTLIVAWREFRQQVRSRGFLLSAFGAPIIFMIIWIFVAGSGGGSPSTPAPAPEQRSVSSEIVGYVDQAAIISMIPPDVPADRIVAYPDVEAAEAALARGVISVYYIIMPEYRDTGAVQWVGLEVPIAPSVPGWFEQLLLENALHDALPDAETETLERLYRPLGASRPLYVEVGDSGETDGESSQGADAPSDRLQWLPFVFSLLVMLPLFTSGGYLFQSVVQEKSNRVMEVLLLSLRPRQLLAGKLVGLGVLTLVQYVAWGGIFLLVQVVFGGGVSELSADVDLTAIDLTFTELLLTVLYALGGYALYATLMAGVGALPDTENSRAWIFVLSLPMLIPLYLWTAIVAAPHGPLAVALSLFPFSAPITMLMRVASTTVPLWQLGVSLTLLLLTTLGMIVLMARLFRAQTLLSGESLSIRRLWGALNG